MKKWLSLSLRDKILYTTTAISFFVVLLTLGLSSFFEIADFKNRLFEQYKVTIRLMASNLGAAVVFQDGFDSQEIMNSLRAYDSIKKAELFLTDGQVLASYTDSSFESELNLNSAIENQFKGKHLYLSEAIVVNEQQYGTLVVYGELKEYRHYLFVKIAIIIAMLAIALLLALLLASKLGKMLTQPILDLTETAEQITRNQDFSIRHQDSSKAEIGKLVDSFNNMIAQIETQNDVILSNVLRFKSYFDQGVVGIAILDSKMRFAETNNQLSKILGFTEDELKKMSWDEILSDQPDLTLKGIVEGAKLDNAVLKREGWILNKNEDPIYIMISVGYIQQTKTIGEQYTLILQDITERKRNEELMLYSKDKAIASNKAKDDFLSVMSHELRTPLNPIIGFTEILLSEPNDPESENFLNKISKSAHHLLNIIDSILNYTRIEKGIIEIGSEKISYVELCENAIATVEQADYASGITFTLEHELVGKLQGCEPPQILVDETKTIQILVNLLSNAAKFTPKGNVRVKTRLVKTNFNGAELSFSVSDEGIGIQKDLIEGIFTPFQQADGSLSRKHGGIGLGLSISKKLVSLLGGKIQCQSEYKKGSCFTFSIPVLLTKDHQIQNNQSTHLIKNGKIQSKRILIIEDDPTNKELITAMIEKLGHSADVATNGLDGVRMANEAQYELILMDIQMPKMNGFEATKSIRETLPHELPIIAITAHAGMAQEEYTKHGMNGFLNKPFSLAQLEKMIEQTFCKL